MEVSGRGGDLTASHHSSQFRLLEPWRNNGKHSSTNMSQYFCVCVSAEKELVTPPLDGIILPGVTRQSLLDLSRAWVSTYSSTSTSSCTSNSSCIITGPGRVPATPLPFPGHLTPHPPQTSRNICSETTSNHKAQHHLWHQNPLGD